MVRWWGINGDVLGKRVGNGDRRDESVNWNGYESCSPLFHTIIYYLSHGSGIEIRLVDRELVYSTKKKTFRDDSAVMVILIEA